MKQIIRIGLILILFINCKKNNENNFRNEQKKESIKGCSLDIAENEIIKLEEVDSKAKFIDSISNHKKGIALISDSLDIEGKPFFEIKTGYNSDIRFETYFTFYVEKGNCSNIKIFEPVEGNIISLSEWRNNKNAIKKELKTDETNQISLPFDLEDLKKCEDCGKNYPHYKSNELQNIAKIAIEVTQYNPDKIYSIKNGNQEFQTYVIQYSGDAISQTLINVKNNQLIASQSIGYELGGEEESYQTFLINKDLSINIYDVNYNSKSKKILTIFQIKKDGSVVKVK